MKTFTEFLNEEKVFTFSFKDNASKTKGMDVLTSVFSPYSMSYYVNDDHLVTFTDKKDANVFSGYLEDENIKFTMKAVNR